MSRVTQWALRARTLRNESRARSRVLQSKAIELALRSGFSFDRLPLRLQAQHLVATGTPLHGRHLIERTHGADLALLLARLSQAVMRHNFLLYIQLIAWLRIHDGSEDHLPGELRTLWANLQVEPRACRESTQTCSSIMHMVGRFDLAEAIELAGKLHLDQAFERPAGLHSETLYFSAIGHLALLDYLLRAVSLSHIPSDRVQLLRGANPIANMEYARLLEARANELGVSVGEWRAVPPQWQEPDLELWPTRDSSYAVARHRYGTVFKQWAREGRPPQLALDASTRARAERLLIGLGADHDRWVAGLHLRAGNELSRSLRNTDLPRLQPSVQLVAESGGQVVLVGDFPGRLPDDACVVDARGLRGADRDALHCYVWACSRFFAGNLSGGTFPPSTFGTPTLWLDTYPVAHIRPPSGVDLLVPKLVTEIASGRILTLSEMLGRTHSRSQVESPELAEEYGYSVKSSEPQDLRNAFLDAIDNTGEATLAAHPLDSRVDDAYDRVGMGTGARLAPSFLDTWGDALF